MNTARDIWRRLFPGAADYEFSLWNTSMLNEWAASLGYKAIPPGPKDHCVVVLTTAEARQSCVVDKGYDAYLAWLNAKFAPKVTYSVVRDAHSRGFLREDGYGFIAEFWTTPQGLRVLATNKGCDIPAIELQELVQAAINAQEG